MLRLVSKLTCRVTHLLLNDIISHRTGIVPVVERYRCGTGHKARGWYRAGRVLMSNSNTLTDKRTTEWQNYMQ